MKVAPADTDVGDFEEDDFLFATADHVGQKAAHVFQTILLIRHELGVGKNGDLRAHSITIIGEINQFGQLLPIIRLRLHPVAASI